MKRSLPPPWWRLQRLLTPPTPPPLDSSAWLRGPPSDHQLRHCLLPPPSPERSVFPSFLVTASRRTSDSPFGLGSSAPPSLARSTQLIPSPPPLSLSPPPPPAPPLPRARIIQPPSWIHFPSSVQRRDGAASPTGPRAPSPLPRLTPPHPQWTPLCPLPSVSSDVPWSPPVQRAPPPSGSELPLRPTTPTDRPPPSSCHPTPPPPRPPKPKMAPSLQKDDNYRSPAKGGGSGAKAKGSSRRRNPGRPARKTGSYAPSDESEGMPSAPTTPVRDKRDNTAINPSPQSSGHRRRRGGRGGNRGRGKKTGVEEQGASASPPPPREGRNRRRGKKLRPVPAGLQTAPPPPVLGRNQKGPTRTPIATTSTTSMFVRSTCPNRSSRTCRSVERTTSKRSHWTASASPLPLR